MSGLHPRLVSTGFATQMLFGGLVAVTPLALTVRFLVHRSDGGVLPLNDIEFARMILAEQRLNRRMKQRRLSAFQKRLLSNRLILLTQANDF